MTVSFLSHSSGIAGAEKAFPKLLEGLQNQGIKVYVFLPERGPIEQVLKEKNLEYFVLRYGRWINSDRVFWSRTKRTLRNLIMVVPLALKIKKLKCNIVYTNTSTIVTGAIAAKLLNLPHIWHFREFGSEDYGYQYDMGSQISHWLTNYLSTVCLTNSYAVKRKYETFIPSHKLKVLYESYKIDTQGYDSQLNKVLDEKSFNCIMIGTLHPAKGHTDAIRSVKLLLELGISVKLHIIGTGDESYLLKLNKLIDSLQIRSHVKFWGYLSNPLGILKQSDLLLMCSRKEAFGLVTLEAMENGIPVIGTNTGGTVELIIDKFTGLTYEHGNFQELAEKIKIYFDNPELRSQYTRNALKHITKLLSPDKYIHSTIEVLYEFL